MKLRIVSPTFLRFFHRVVQPIQSFRFRAINGRKASVTKRQARAILGLVQRVVRVLLRNRLIRVIRRQSHDAKDAVSRFRRATCLSRNGRSVFPVERFRLGHSVSLLVRRVSDLIGATGQLEGRLRKGRLRLLSGGEEASDEVNHARRAITESFVISQAARLFKVIRCGVHPFVSLRRLHPRQPTKASGRVTNRVGQLHLIGDRLRRIGPFITRPEWQLLSRVIHIVTKGFGQVSLRSSSAHLLRCVRFAFRFVHFCFVSIPPPASGQTMGKL